MRRNDRRTSYFFIDFFLSGKKKKKKLSFQRNYTINTYVVMKIAAAKIYFKELLISLFITIPFKLVSDTTSFLFSLQSFPSASKLLIAV